MTPKKPFIDPYKGCENPTRLQSYINRDDYNYIRSIHPDKGTIQIVTNNLWYQLVKTLKSNGITDITHIQQFEHAITDLVIEIPRRTESNRGTASRSTRKATGKV